MTNEEARDEETKFAVRDEVTTLLADVEASRRRAIRKGQSAFSRDSDEYAHAIVAAARLGVITEEKNQEKYAEFLGYLTRTDREIIRMTRNTAVHGGYAGMRDDMFWRTLTINMPAILQKLHQCMRDNYAI